MLAVVQGGGGALVRGFTVFHIQLFKIEMWLAFLYMEHVSKLLKEICESCHLQTQITQLLLDRSDKFEILQIHHETPRIKFQHRSLKNPV